MLYELCLELKNFFDRERYAGSFTISGGTFTADYLQTGQYFRIVGSVFNDGIYMYPCYCLHDESFDGAIWALAIPKEILEMAEEIQAWRAKYEAADSAAMSPFNSESFGGYSYSKSGNSSSAGGVASGGGWKAAFAHRLNKWRKLR